MMPDSPAPVGPPASPPPPLPPGAANQPAEQHKYDALVFVPGMGGANPDQSSEGVAKRVAKALERASQDRAVRFELGPKGQDEVIGKDASGEEVRVGVRTIVRRVGENGKPEPVLDVYARNYSEKFTGPYERSSLFYKCLILLVTLLRYTWPVLRSLVQKTGKSPREKAQLVWAGVLVSVLWAYMGVLLVAVYTTASQLIGNNVAIPAQEPPDGKKDETTKEGEKKDDGKGAVAPTTGGEPVAAKPAEITHPTGWWTQWSQRVAVTGAFVLAIWPNVQKQLSRVAILYLCAVQYLDGRDGRPAMVGDVTDILAHVLRKQNGDGKESPYRRVNVIAYSFGSVITLDALFPFADSPSVPCRHVHTLFTVGCPFDIIRTYWDGYFTDRYAGEAIQTRWLNVYSPKDILGSNFRNDDESKPPMKGIEFKPPPEVATGATSRPPFTPAANIEFRDGPAGKQSLLETVVLGGLKAHMTYWDAEDEGATSWYSIMVTQLYTGDPILGETTTAGGPI